MIKSKLSGSKSEETPLVKIVPSPTCQPPQPSLRKEMTKESRGNLPKVAVNQLKKWLFDHFEHPYPRYCLKLKLILK
jgi:hypothetical protein